MISFIMVAALVVFTGFLNPEPTRPNTESLVHQSAQLKCDRVDPLDDHLEPILQDLAAKRGPRDEWIHCQRKLQPKDTR